MYNVQLYEHTLVPKLIPVTSEKFTIGRGIDNSHVVEDINVSRQHSVLECLNNEWYIFDKSSNGTWVNDQLVGKDAFRILADGDVIKLSNICKYTFKCMPALPQTICLTEEELLDVAEAVVENAPEFNKEFRVDESGDVKVPDLVKENITQPSPTCSVSDANISEQPSCSTTKVSKLTLGSIEDELQCSICTEMFVKAVTLSCSHTFCSYCIAEWQKNKEECPICRCKITTKCPTIILDNYIDKIIENADHEFKKHRLEVIAERQVQCAGATFPSTSAEMPTVPSIQLASIEVSSDEEVESSDFSDTDDCNSDYEDLDPAAYYGGYGRCYLCGNRGHWANTCTYRIR